METLIVYPNLLRSKWYLKDANGFVLGCFDAIAEAQAWCKENSYHCRVQS